MVKKFSNFVTIFACLISVKLLAVEVRPIDRAVSFIAAEYRTISQVLINPKNQSLIASLSDEGELSVWDLASQSLQWRQFVMSAEARVCFSNDGASILVGANDFLVRYAVSNGEPIESIDLRKSSHPGPNSGNFLGRSYAIKSSKSDQLVYVAMSTQSPLLEIDMVSGLVSKKYEPDTVNYQFWGLDQILLSDNEKFLFIQDDHNFYSFDVQSGRMGFRYSWTDVEGLPTEISARAISRDGIYSAVASGIYLYVIENVSHQIVRRQFAAADRITSLTFSMDLTQVILSSGDGTSRIFDIATGVEKLRLDDTRPQHLRSWQWSVASTPDLSQTVTGDTQGYVRAWR